MAADAHGVDGDVPISGLARAARRRVEATFVAPVTLGRPQWRRRYRRVKSTMLAVGSVETVAALVERTRQTPAPAGA